MSKVLRQLLGAKEPVYSLRIGALEAASGHHKTDLSFLSDILVAARSGLKNLGLDPDDTTSIELRSAIKTRAQKDDQELKKSVRSDKTRLIEKINKKHPGTEIPVVSHSALKKILVKRPPKKVMTALGYRSADSMLKRAALDQLLVGSFMLESISWHRGFAAALKKLSSSDITMIKPRAVLIDKRLLKKARFNHLVSIQAAGLVGIPEGRDVEGAFLNLAVQAAEGLFHVHVRGQLLKLNRFSGDFTKNLAQYTYTTPEAVGDIGKVAVPWSSVYSFLSANSGLDEILSEAEASPSDFAWKVPSNALGLLSTRLNDWAATEAAGVVSAEHTISLNISDIAHDLINLVPYSNSTQRSLRRCLATGVLARYLRIAPHRDRIMKNVGISV